MTPDAGLYGLHGMRVRSELPLDAPAPSTPGDPDVELRLAADAPFPAEPEAGELISHLETAAGPVTAWLTRAGLLIRFGDAFAYTLTPDGRRLDAYVGDGDPRLTGTLAAGTVLSFVLGVRGIPVLHASAVAVGDRTIAVAGASGAGKTTLATLLCLAGGSIVSDDVLRVELVDGRVVCWSGTTTLRLRPWVADLAEGFGGETVTATADGRTAVAPRAIEGPRPLDALLVLERSDVFAIERMRARDALVALLSHPRFAGWKSSEPMRGAFGALASLAGVLPVHRARIPPGPPFPPDLVERILAAAEPA